MYKMVSIIIATYNPGNSFNNALTSVWSQNSSNYELIIIDGGSTDNTVNLLKANESRITYWHTEPDQGIYDAMNKGINKAKGDWIYFLGADDCLAPNILVSIEPHLNDETKLVFGDVLFENGYRMRSFLGPRTWLQNTLHHQSAFYHRSLFSTFRYDLNLRIIADYELNLKTYAEQAPTTYVPLVVAHCQTGGASGNLWVSLKETNQIRGQYIGSKWKHAGLCAFLWWYYAQKQIRYLLYGHRV